jgi:CheY-like chemotaxis protein
MKKIMIVDDEETLRTVVKKILEKGGYDIIEAADGRDCLEKLKGVKPDLILLDVMMPEMNGWEVCKEIRENPDTKDIIVAMLTVKSEDEHKVKSLDEAQADWHIAKPVRRQKLLQTINWLFERRIVRE